MKIPAALQIAEQDITKSKFSRKEWDMNTEMLLELLETWGLADISCVEPIPSYWAGATSIRMNSGERFVLKKVGLEKDLNREVKLLGWLEKREIPAATVMEACSGEYYAEWDKHRYVLYSWLNGAVVDEHYGPGCQNRAKDFGIAIGRLHRALAEWEYENELDIVDLIGQIQTCILKISKSDEDQLECNEIISIAEKCIRELKNLRQPLPCQWIHRDIHPGNMLFASGKLTGIIDFDLLQIAPRIFDPCYCSTSILISGWQNSENRNSWPELLSCLLAGYNEFIELTDPERESMCCVLCAIEIFFITFSIGRREIDQAISNQEVLFWLHQNRKSIGL
jgi:Ser/Thr protein kinase RdoA (MazF antagonist)